MLTDLYIHRLIGEYEALNFRASAVLEIAEDTPDAHPNLIQQAARMVSLHHLQRITRLNQQLGFNLRNRPDILSDIVHDNQSNIERTARFLDQDQPDPTHTDDEITLVAILLLILANLRAMRHINAEIISRTDDDPVKHAYLTVLHDLLTDDQCAQTQFQINRVDPERLTELRISQLLQQAQQASQQAASIIETQRNRQQLDIDDLIAESLATTCPTVPWFARTRFPIRTLDDNELAAAADGLRVFNKKLSDAGLKALADGDQFTAHAAHVIAQQAKEAFQSRFADRVTPCPDDGPHGPDLSQRRYQRMLQPTDQLEQATAHIRHTAVANSQSRATYDLTIATLAIMAHTAALRWHFPKFAHPKPNQTHQPTEHASVSWIHENVIGQTIASSPQPSSDKMLRHWTRAYRTLDEISQSPDVVAAVEEIRPRISNPNVASPLNHSLDVAFPSEFGVTVTHAPDQMTHDWIITYQYQGAVYDKRIGDPYDHPIEPFHAQRHALDLLEQSHRNVQQVSDDCNNHLQNLAVITYELAAANLHWIPPDALRNVINAAFLKIQRTSAIHHIIEDLAGDRPAAAAHLKATYHPGSEILDDDQAAAIIKAARDAGVEEPDITEICHRLNIRPQFMADLNVPSHTAVARPEARQIVIDILHLAPKNNRAAHTAAREMGWTLHDLDIFPDHQH